MKIRFVLFIFILITFTGYKIQAQDCKNDINNNAFKTGEELRYLISYNWNFVWVDAGSVLFRVKEEKVGNRELLHLFAQGKTFKSWDWFFKVDDVYQSWVDSSSLKPYYFKRKVREGGYKIDINYKFIRNRDIAYAETIKPEKPVQYDTIAVNACTYDLMSIVYYARCIDFSKYEPNTMIPITLLLDRELTNIYFRYKGKEVVDVKGLGKFNAIKFSAYLVEGTIFEAGEDLNIWVTDDENKIPVFIEAPILVGAIKVRLVDYKGLKNDFSSWVEKYE